MATGSELDPPSMSRKLVSPAEKSQLPRNANELQTFDETRVVAETGAVKRYCTRNAEPDCERVNEHVPASVQPWDTDPVGMSQW